MLWCFVVTSACFCLRASHKIAARWYGYHFNGHTSSFRRTLFRRALFRRALFRRALFRRALFRRTLVRRALFRRTLFRRTRIGGYTALSRLVANEVRHAKKASHQNESYETST
jgi:uncharacterized protein YjbI with pentapeptide repeats